MNEGKDRLDLIKFKNELQKKDWYLSRAVTNFTIQDNDRIKTLWCSTPGGTTVILPLAANNKDRVIECFKVCSNPGALTIATQGSDIINSGTPATISINLQFQGYRLKSDGVSIWYILDKLMNT
jgi:hypothetical protein